MKILLIGEFSGFYLTLKSGLNALGCDVTLASTGDSWRRFEKDISLVPNIGNVYLENAYRYFLPCLNLSKLYGYDIVQFVNPAILSPVNPFNEVMGRKIIKESGRVFLSAAGDDAFYWDARNNLRYNPLDDAKKIDYGGKKLGIEYAWYRSWNRKLVGLVDKVIPVMYDYAQAYRAESFDNIAQTIPLPIDLKKFQYVGSSLSQRKKIRFFHGLNRSGYKGTGYIQKAFAILSERYSSYAEFVIGDRMPFNEYVENLSLFDVIVDQANSYSCGINGLLGLALGKVVVGGAEPESLAEMGVTESPVINIKPDVEDIIKKLSSIIENRNSLQLIGEKSRNFAENNHDHIEVAKRYLKEWGYV